VSEDLVPELKRHEREYPSLVHGPLCGKAAAEIGRLHAQLASSNATLADIENGLQSAQIKDLEAQLASATERVAEMQHEAGMYHSLYDVATERLASTRKAALQEAIDIAQRYDDCGAQFIIEKLQSLSLTDDLRGK
jgi:hypothetical protein